MWRREAVREGEVTVKTEAGRREGQEHGKQAAHRRLEKSRKHECSPPAP